MSARKRNLWPYAIIAYFVFFITGIAIWIGYATRNQMELVRPDYYDQEIKYQAQIDRVTRTQALHEPVEVAYYPQRGSVTIVLPEQHRQSELAGELYLYRPSNAGLDKKIPLAMGGTQTLNVADLAPGLWKLKVSWAVEGVEYYFDQPLIIAAN